MQNEIETTEKAEPRKLEKPAQEQEMDREQLVTYSNESGGGSGPSTAPS